MRRQAQLLLPWRECDAETLPETREAAPLVLVPPPVSGRLGEPSLPVTAAAAPTFVRNGRARRYILRVLPDATVRVTIPRHGSKREAEAFVRTRSRWIADRRRELEATHRDTRWRAGQRIWWRGVRETVQVTASDDGVRVRCGELQTVTTLREDYRPVLEPLMRARALVELPPRLRALATQHQLQVARVTVRSQRSRWGSCSRDGNIALNWRLLQMPEAVCEYVLLHELMHLREPNHSARFWAEVAAVCPGYATSRAWLRSEGLVLC